MAQLSSSENPKNKIPSVGLQESQSTTSEPRSLGKRFLGGSGRRCRKNHKQQEEAKNNNSTIETAPSSLSYRSFSSAAAMWESPSSILKKPTTAHDTCSSEFLYMESSYITAASSGSSCCQDESDDFFHRQLLEMNRQRRRRVRFQETPDTTSSTTAGQTKQQQRARGNFLFRSKNQQNQSTASESNSSSSLLAPAATLVSSPSELWYSSSDMDAFRKAEFHDGLHTVGIWCRRNKGGAKKQSLDPACRRSQDLQKQAWTFRHVLEQVLFVTPSGSSSSSTASSSSNSSNSSNNSDATTTSVEGVPLIELPSRARTMATPSEDWIGLERYVSRQTLDDRTQRQKGLVEAILKEQEQGQQQKRESPVAFINHLRSVSLERSAPSVRWAHATAVMAAAIATTEEE